MTGRLVRDALLWHEPASFSRSFAYLCAVLLAAFVRTPGSFLVDGAVINDGHALASLEVALNQAYCGDASHVSSRYRVPYDLQAQPELRVVPLRTLIERKAGSISEYCSTINAQFVNNENALMLLEAATLKAFPRMSLKELGRALQMYRIAALSAFALLLLREGASLTLALAVTLWAFVILHSMPTHVYSVYPFLFVLLLAMVALYGFALECRWTGDARISLIAGAGLLSAFIVNMRSSYLPIVLIFFVVFLAADWRVSTARRQVVHLFAVTASFGIGFAALQLGVIQRFVPRDLAFQAVHPVAHPLVLALAVPENDFGRALNITWVDATGARLALETDAQASYLGPRYNGALMRYYTNLWRSHPREMIKTYEMKFSVAGHDMIEVLRGSPGTTGLVTRWLLTPLSWLPNGWWLLAFDVAVAFSAAARFVRKQSVLAFSLALVALAACLLQVESGMIYSLYVVNYHNYLAFFAMFITLLGLQALVDASWRAVSLVAK